jgi:hypothetical protein
MAEIYTSLWFWLIIIGTLLIVLGIIFYQIYKNSSNSGTWALVAIGAGALLLLIGLVVALISYNSTPKPIAVVPACAPKPVCPPPAPVCNPCAPPAPTYNPCNPCAPKVNPCNPCEPPRIEKIVPCTNGTIRMTSPMIMYKPGNIEYVPPTYPCGNVCTPQPEIKMCPPTMAYEVEVPCQSPCATTSLGTAVQPMGFAVQPTGVQTVAIPAQQATMGAIPITVQGGPDSGLICQGGVCQKPLQPIPMIK